MDPKSLICATMTGFLAFLILIWVLQELTIIKILRYVILFMGMLIASSFDRESQYVHVI